MSRLAPQYENDGLWDDVRNELRVVAQERLDYFWSQGIRGADFFISAIGPALSVFGKYERVTKLSGEEVTVGQFLDEVRSLVSNYALTKILKTSQTASIDPESRFYVVWKWSYADAKVHADESFKLSQALGMPTEMMWDRTGTLEKAGENVQAMPIAKRMKIKDLGDPSADGSPGSLIDVLHRLCVFREKNDTDGMVQFLARSGQANNPALWVVAQAVSEILPDGDKEKQLMQGLLNQKEKIEQMPASRDGCFEERMCDAAIHRRERSQQQRYSVRSLSRDCCRRRWSLEHGPRICAAEKDHFGDYLREIHGGEMKAKKLLKPDRFQEAQRPVPIAPDDCIAMANSLLRKGKASKGQPTNNPTFLEIVAFSRKVLEFVHTVLDIAAGFSVQVFASVVDQDAPKPEPGRLRKDYVYLFERYFYFLETLPARERGLIVFDELDKAQSHVLLQQVAAYFWERKRADTEVPGLCPNRSSCIPT